MRTTLYLPCGLLAATLLWACEKDDESPVPTEGTNTSQVDIAHASIVLMDVNGTTTTLQSGGGVNEIISTATTGGPSPDTSAAVFLAGFASATDTLFRLRIGTLEFTGGNPTTAELESFLAPGTRVLGELSGGGDGLTLEWRDGSGNWFGSSCGSGAVAASFEITHIAAQQIGPEHYVKFRAVFSGTFHSCDGSAGDVTISDGVLVLRVRDLS